MQIGYFRYHNENAIDTNDERFVWEISESASLSINPIQAVDVGEYYCLAENEVGQGRSHKIKINVICKYSSDDLFTFYTTCLIF